MEREEKKKSFGAHNTNFSPPGRHVSRVQIIATRGEKAPNGGKHPVGMPACRW